VIDYCFVFFPFKVVSPKEWKPRASGYENLDLVIPSPVTQIVMGSQGFYQQDNMRSPSMHIKKYEELANSKQ
jgi:[histone H3]-trimethyl-L-lysine9/36 demethylase